MYFTIQQRFDRIKHIPYSKLGESLVGSAAACGKVCEWIRSRQHAAACLESGLLLLFDDFSAMSRAFDKVPPMMNCPYNRKLWTQNTTNTVRQVQATVQLVAQDLKHIVRGYDMWHVVLPDHVHCALHAFQILLQQQELYISLIKAVMWVLRPSQSASYQSAEEVQRKKLWDVGREVQNALRTRQQMKHSLQEIAARQSELNQSCSVNSPGELSVTGWSASQSTITMGVMTPTEDWSEIGSRAYGASTTHTWPHAHESIGFWNMIQARKDLALEAVLDSCEYKALLYHEDRDRNLARLVFHWTNVETFEGIQRSDVMKN